MAGAEQFFYLVPSDLLDFWRSQAHVQQVDKPLERAMYSTSKDLTNVVRDSDQRDPHAARADVTNKLALYREMRKQRDDVISAAGQSTTTERQPPPPQPLHQPRSDGQSTDAADILASVPRSYRAAAKRLLTTWERSVPAFGYDKATGIVSLEGAPIAGSNIGAIVRSAVSRARGVPTGGDQILRYMHKNMDPSDSRMISNPTIRDLIRSSTSPASSELSEGELMGETVVERMAGSPDSDEHFASADEFSQIEEEGDDDSSLDLPFMLVGDEDWDDDSDDGIKGSDGRPRDSGIYMPSHWHSVTP